MTELDLLLIRQREHEMQSLRLRKQAYELEGGNVFDSQWMFLDSCLLDAIHRKEAHIQALEQQGHDYLTITAEMAKIRAEVRGEK